MRRCVVVALVVVIRGVAIGARQFLGHNNFRAASAARYDVELIHEGAHQENSASGGAEKIFFGERIGDISEIEPFALVQNVDDHFVGCEIDGQVNFLLGAFLIAVVKRVDDPFAHGHSDAVAIVLIKAGGFGDPQTHLLCDIYAFYLRVERDIEVFLVSHFYELPPA